MKIEEACACGASLVIEAADTVRPLDELRDTMRHVRQWRNRHKHEFAPKRLASARAMGFAAYRAEDDDDPDDDGD